MKLPPKQIKTQWQSATETAAASGPASQIDMGQSEGQRGYYNNKHLVSAILRFDRTYFEKFVRTCQLAIHYLPIYNEQKQNCFSVYF